MQTAPPRVLRDTRWVAVLALATALAACDDGAVAVDAGSDAGSGLDAGRADGGAVDGGTPTDLVGPTITTFIPSGPIVVTSGMTIEGLHITSTTGACIWGSDVSDVRITNNRIGPCGPDESGNGISFERASDARIDHNFFDDVATGYYVAGNGDNVVFDHNRVERVRGPRARGQMVQFNQVNGSGNQVICNISNQTTPGYLDGPEDHISMFGSSGTAESPILVAYNKIRGGGPSVSGGGALAGDYGGSYITIQGNILIDPGQYGLAIAGGTNHKLLDNLVYSPEPFAWSNNGLFVWGQGTTTDPSTCYGHEVRRNRVYYVHRDGYANAGWDGGNCGEIAGFETDNNFSDETLSAAIWDIMIPECQ